MQGEPANGIQVTDDQKQLIAQNVLQLYQKAYASKHGIKPKLLQDEQLSLASKMFITAIDLISRFSITTTIWAGLVGILENHKSYSEFTFPTIWTNNSNSTSFMFSNGATIGDGGQEVSFTLNFLERLFGQAVFAANIQIFASFIVPFFSSIGKACESSFTTHYATDAIAQDLLKEHNYNTFIEALEEVLPSNIKENERLHNAILKSITVSNYNNVNLNSFANNLNHSFITDNFLRNLVEDGVAGVIFHHTPSKDYSDGKRPMTAGEITGASAAVGGTNMTLDAIAKVQSLKHYNVANVGVLDKNPSIQEFLKVLAVELVKNYGRSMKYLAPSIIGRALGRSLLETCVRPIITSQITNEFIHVYIRSLYEGIRSGLFQQGGIKLVNSLYDYCLSFFNYETKALDYNKGFTENSVAMLQNGKSFLQSVNYFKSKKEEETSLKAIFGDITKVDLVEFVRLGQESSPNKYADKIDDLTKEEQTKAITQIKLLDKGFTTLKTDLSSLIEDLKTVISYEAKKYNENLKEYDAKGDLLKKIKKQNDRITYYQAELMNNKKADISLCKQRIKDHKKQRAVLNKRLANEVPNSFAPNRVANFIAAHYRLTNLQEQCKRNISIEELEKGLSYFDGFQQSLAFITDEFNKGGFKDNAFPGKEIEKLQAGYNLEALKTCISKQFLKSEKNKLDINRIPNGFHSSGSRVPLVNGNLSVTILSEKKVSDQKEVKQITVKL